MRRELSENEREGSNSTTCERGQARVTEGHRHRQRHRHRHLEEREEGDASSDLSNDSLDLVHNVLAKEEGRGRQEEVRRCGGGPQSRSIRRAAYVSICQRTSACVSVSIREHT